MIYDRLLKIYEAKIAEDPHYYDDYVDFEDWLHLHNWISIEPEVDYTLVIPRYKDNKGNINTEVQLRHIYFKDNINDKYKDLYIS